MKKYLKIFKKRRKLLSYKTLKVLNVDFPDHHF